MYKQAALLHYDSVVEKSSCVFVADNMEPIFSVTSEGKIEVAPDVTPERGIELYKMIGLLMTKANVFDEIKKTVSATQAS